MQSTDGVGEATQNHLSTKTQQNIEMNELDESKRAGAGSQEGGLLNDVSIPTTSPITSNFTSTLIPTGEENTIPADEQQSKTQTTTSSSSVPRDLSSSTTNDPVASPAVVTNTSDPQAPSPIITRLDSTAIESATMNTPTVPIEAGPTLVITLLLTSGARHPFKIDDKYLTKRNVNVPEKTTNGKNDPFSISVYTLKELILREWREEWETQPSSPSSIRLIFFGKLLDDKTALKDHRFNADAANVVHMTVRPQDIVDEEDAAKGKAGGGSENARGESTAGCRCVIL